MKLASIQTITNIREIPSAERIEAATVLGYQTVIKKGEFRPFEETRSAVLPSGRLSAKVLSERYALKHGE